MDKYTIVKNEVNKRLLFKMSQIGYALHCDLLFTVRIPEIEQNVELVNHLKNGDKIFISVIQGELTIDLNRLKQILIQKKIKVVFYLMYEPIIPENVLQFLFPVAAGFFLNNNVYEHPLIHCMPIGIRDCEKVVPNHRGFSHDFLFKEGLKTVEKELLCLLCFSYTHDERSRCHKELKNKWYVENLNDNTYEKQPSIHCGKVPVWINYEFTHKSHYTLSPRGCGEDCHRFYEALYLDSIPIVKKTNTNFDKMYSIFPCLIVNDWSDVTEDLLINNQNILYTKIVEFKRKYPNAFTDLQSIDELLLQT